ncbi:MAG: hypothetical protein R3A47_04195 [Polyangiales bacterium]
MTIGGQTYQSKVGPNGGDVTVTHNGKPVTFNIDCKKADVHCPSESLAKRIRFEQDNPNDWKVFKVTDIDTGNSTGGAFRDGKPNSFNIFLGAGLGGQGICGVLGLALAGGDWVYPAGSLVANGIKNGEVAVGFAGACVAANQQAALGLGATLKLSVKFTAKRVN